MEKHALSSRCGHARGELLAALGRDDEALASAATARELGQADDAVTQLMWRATEGRVRARRGELEEAERITVSSVETVADEPITVILSRNGFLRSRSRLLHHWTDVRHPYHERFSAQRALVEEILSSPDSPEQLDQRLRERGTSLRCVVREIPPVFGSFF